MSIPVKAITALLFAAIAFIVYIPTLGNSFVNWDDPIFIAYPQIQSMDLGWMLTSTHSANWVPLSLISHAIDIQLWGLDPWGHHLTSLILHAADTALVFLVSMAIFSKLPSLGNAGRNAAMGGAFAALLFALHPIHVESVSWVAERRDVLSALFMLLSVLFYLRYAEGRGRALSYALSLAMFGAALMSKPMVVTLPAVLLILDYYPLKRLSLNLAALRLFYEKIPFLILGILASAAAVLTQWRSDAVSSLADYGLYYRVLMSVRALGFYLYKTFVPLGFMPYYDRPSVDYLYPQFFMAAFAIAVMAGLAIFYWRRTGSRAFIAAFAFFVVTLLPVIGIIQIGSQAAADRYMYIPSIGIFVLMGGVAAFVLQRSVSSAVRYGLPVLMAVVLVFLSAQTVRQQRVWKDSFSLWTHQIELDTNGRFSRFVAHTQRGVMYLKDREYGKAIADYSAAIALNPRFGKAYLQRGRAYMAVARYEEALMDFKAAAALMPDNADITADMNAAYGKLRDREDSARSYGSQEAVFGPAR